MQFHILIVCTFFRSTLLLVNCRNQNCTQHSACGQTMDSGTVMFSVPFLVISFVLWLFWPLVSTELIFFSGSVCLNSKILLLLGNSQLRAHCFVCDDWIVFSHVIHFNMYWNPLSSSFSVFILSHKVLLKFFEAGFIIASLNNLALPASFFTSLLFLSFFFSFFFQVAYEYAEKHELQQNSACAFLYFQKQLLLPHLYPLTNYLSTMDAIASRFLQKTL